MAITDGDILRVSTNFELQGGTQYQNIYHFIRDGTDPYSDAVHITAIKTRLDAAYDELVAYIHQATTVQLSFVDRIQWNEIVDEWRVTDNIGTWTPALTPVGGTAGLPFQSSPYIIFKTQRPRTVGKKFLFPLVESAQDNTVLESAAVTAITAMATILMTAISLGGDATLTMGVPRTGVNSWYNFLVAVVSDLLGSQRRRRPGVGA